MKMKMEKNFLLGEKIVCSTTYIWKKINPYICSIFLWRPLYYGCDVHYVRGDDENITCQCDDKLAYRICVVYVQRKNIFSSFFRLPHWLDEIERESEQIPLNLSLSCNLHFWYFFSLLRFFLVFYIFILFFLVASIRFFLLHTYVWR